jgi:FkbM family methyltransferase
MSTLTKIVNRWGLIKGLKMYYRFNKVKSGTWILPELKHPVQLRPNTTDSMVFKQIFGKGEYDIDFAFTPQTIIDGGGNIGLFSVLMANRYPQASIFAIEPDTLNFLQFKKNTANYPNIIPINAGIWNHSCFLEILDEGYGQYALQVKEAKEGVKTDLKGISIGDLMEQYSLESLDIVKLDVEGAEAMIFQDNYDNWLSRTKVLIIELHEGCWPGSSINFETIIKNYPFSRSKNGEFWIFTRN